MLSVVCYSIGFRMLCFALFFSCFRSCSMCASIVSSSYRRHEHGGAGLVAVVVFAAECASVVAAFSIGSASCLLVFLCCRWKLMA